MAKLLNVFIYLIYKAGEVGAAWYLLGKFNLKPDIMVYGLYAFLSLFQLVFFLVQILPNKESEGSILLRYTTLITVLMGILTIGVSTYFLQANYTVKLLTSDYINLLFFDTALVLWLGIFYILHQFAFGPIIIQRQVRFSGASILPVDTLLFFTFGAPIAYFALKKYLFKVEFGGWDHYLLFAGLGVNWLIAFMLLWKRVLKAKFTVRHVLAAQQMGSPLDIPVNDENEIGLIQSQLQGAKAGTRAVSPQSAAAAAVTPISSDGLNGYLSQNIRNQVSQNGIVTQGELKTVSVVTFNYDFDQIALTAENSILLEEKIIRIAGEYADEYDAYPYFSGNRITLVFGVPYYYEHQRYHALEATVKIMTDIDALSEEEGVLVKMHSGLASGNVITGGLPTAGPGTSQYSVRGETVLKSLQIAEVAARIDKKMLTDNETVDGLKTKFFVEKVYKIKLSDLSEQVVNQIKV